MNELVKDFYKNDRKVFVYSYIISNFIIEEDFDSNRAYGPSYGICYEQKLIRAYKNGLLRLKPKGILKQLCTVCNGEGHFDDQCSAKYIV